MADSLILMVLALVVFGPRRLPQIGRQIGKLMYEFRKASNDFKFQMEEELRISEDADRRKKEEEERLRTMTLSAPAQTPPQTIEAQADIGAVDVPPPSPYPGEDTYPPQYPPETPEEPQPIVLPRVQPPTTGEQVSATRPSEAVKSDWGAEANIAAASDSAPTFAAVPVEPANPSAGTSTESAGEPDTPRTEPMNHVG